MSLIPNVKQWSISTRSDKRTLLCVFLFLLSLSSVRAQDSLYARKVINTLCSKQFAGRGYVNNGLDIASKYIAAELKKFKAQPLFNTGYFQWFDFNVNTFPGKMSVSINGKTLKCRPKRKVYGRKKR